MYRLLRRLSRQPLIHWSFVVVLAAITAWSVASAQTRADAARRAWGQTRAVAVATRHIDAGTALSADDVSVESWPAALVPSGALDGAPVGRTVRMAFDRGEPITRARVAPDGVDGVAALVPPGWRAIAVALGDASVPLEPGDQIDLIATSVDGSVSGVVAEAALVVHVGERSVTVALPREVVDRVAGALVSGAVVAALRPATGDPSPR